MCSRAATSSASPRPGPARPPPSCCPCSPCSKRAGPGAHAPHADPRADARTRRAGRGEFRALRRQPPPVGRAADRRRFVRRPGCEDHPRRRRAHRDAGPPARSLRARQAAALRRRAPGHRRGRPHARHGLHPRHRAHRASSSRSPGRRCSSRPPCRRRSSGSPMPSCTTPVRVEVARAASTAATITQRLGRDRPGAARKARYAARPHPRSPDLKNAIIFCNRKRDVAIAAPLAAEARLQCGRPARRHGPAARMAALESFRTGEIKLLVASDVAAPRPRHPGREPRLQLRRAAPCRGLRASHRPHRPRRAHGACLHPRRSGDEKSLAAIEKLIQQPIPWEGRVPSAVRGARARPPGEERTRDTRPHRRSGAARGADRPRERRREATTSPDGDKSASDRRASREGLPAERRRPQRGERQGRPGRASGQQSENRRDRRPTADPANRRVRGPYPGLSAGRPRQAPEIIRRSRLTTFRLFLVS